MHITCRPNPASGSASQPAQRLIAISFVPSALPERQAPARLRVSITRPAPPVSDLQDPYLAAVIRNIDAILGDISSETSRPMAI